MSPRSDFVLLPSLFVFFFVSETKFFFLLCIGIGSSQTDVTDFLRQMNLNSEHYQIGHQKIFLRESEKAKLDRQLHQTILASIVTIQRWFRSCVERRNFLSVRNAVVRIQVGLLLFLVFFVLLLLLILSAVVTDG